MNRRKERQKQYDIAYMQMAEAFGNLSYAQRKKVGAVIVSKDDQVISQGFNGTPHGFSNICEEVMVPDSKSPTGYSRLNFDSMPEDFELLCRRIKDGDTEVKDIELVTKKCVLHAETNAIAKCAKYHNSTKDATLYVTLSPCIDCAKLIVQAEISRVVYKELYRDATEGIDFLKACHIKVEQLDEN